MLEQSQPEFRALAVTVERRRPSAIGGMLAKVLWSATEGAVTARPSGMNIFAIRSYRPKLHSSVYQGRVRGWSGHQTSNRMSLQPLIGHRPAVKWNTDAGLPAFARLSIIPTC